MSNTPVSVTLLDDWTAIESHAADWDRLAAQSPRPVPFLSWKWVATWWKHFGGSSRPMVLFAHTAANEVVGIAPLKVTRRTRLAGFSARTVEFIGYGGSAVGVDHLDFLSSHEDRASIVDALIRTLLGMYNHAWDAIDLSGVADDSLITESMKHHCQAEGFAFRQSDSDTCPYVELAESWPEFLAQKKIDHRSLVRNIKRYRERLESQYSVRFSGDLSQAQRHATLDNLRDLSIASHRARGSTTNFERPDYQKFHHDVLDRMPEACYLARLECDGLLVAASYGFPFGSTMFYYQTSYNPEFRALGVGEILHGLIMEDVIGRLGMKEFDFLRGTEEYKFRWTRLTRNNQRIQGWNATLSGSVARGIFLSRKKLAGLKPMGS